MLIAYEMAPEAPARFEFYDGAPASVFCPRCGDVVDHDYAPRNLGVEALDFDMVSTRDGHSIASQKFRDFSARIGIPNLGLIRVNAAPPLYDLRPGAIVTYDVDCKPPFFENKCSLCGGYESIVGPRYACITGVDFPIREGLYRSDLAFASGREKHPFLVVGLDTAELMKQERLRGVLLTEIHKDVAEGGRV